MNDPRRAQCLEKPKQRKSLLVDFGHRRKSYFAPKSKRTVQFLSEQDVRFFKRPDDENASELLLHQRLQSNDEREMG